MKMFIQFICTVLWYTIFLKYSVLTKGIVNFMLNTAVGTIQESGRLVSLLEHEFEYLFIG